MWEKEAGGDSGGGSSKSMRRRAGLDGCVASRLHFFSCVGGSGWLLDLGKDLGKGGGTMGWPAGQSW